MVNLASFDLNLLTAFEAILAERNVSRAANRVGVSQPTMSNALQRLRHALGDELFRREKGQMTPTPFALELADRLTPAIAQIRHALQLGPGFDPKTSTRRFTLGLSDAGSYLFFNALTKRLPLEAPHIGIDVVSMGKEDAVERIVAEEAELAVGLYLPDHPDIRSEFHETTPYVVLADRDNPHLKDKELDLETFLALPHVVWTAQSSAQNDVDHALSLMGLRRKVVITTPHYLAVPGAVTGTDRLAVFFDPTPLKPDSVARLTVHAVPRGLTLPPGEARVLWHRRRDDDPGLLWLRDLIRSTPPYAD